MSTEQSMEKWLPCQSRCELAGAAAFFLSIENSAVLINGPRWCAMIAEREMASVEKKYEKRMFCSEVKEFDLLYGADDAMLDALDEVKNECNPEVIAVLNNCSVSLIGDDIEGICKRATMNCPVISMDAGGLRGEFWTGYQEAAKKSLAECKLNRTEDCQTNLVNIIGWCTSYPNWKGDLEEVKRMLYMAGIEVGVCLGTDGVTIEEIKKIPLAYCNLVLHPELGVSVAELLKEQLGQEYFIVPIPYGMQGSLAWLKEIASKIGIQINLQRLEEEVAMNQEKIDEAIFQMKGSNKNITFRNAYLELTYGHAYGIVKALQEEFPDLEQIYLRIQGPAEQSYPKIEGVRKWLRFETLEIEEEQSIDLIFGNVQSRLEIGNYHQVIFKNLLLPMQGITVYERPYAGILGWKYLLAEMIEDFQTMVYLNPASK